MEYKKFEWHDNDNMFSVYQAYEEGKPEYPVICPECGNRSAHLYINRYKDTHRGGVWVWCSECHAFEHGSYIVPLWWDNHTCVNQANLCGANPEELVQYETVLDDHINSQLMRYCMLDNVCQYCLHKNGVKPKMEKCPECGQETWMATLDGPCMIVSCSACGLKVVGASFFPPCHNDYLDYEFTIVNVPKEKKIKIAKLFGLNVKDLIEELREKSEFKRSYKLPMAEKIINELNELEVDFIISPDLINKYPHLIGCKSF